MGRSDSNERVAKPKKERKAKIPKDQRVRKPKLPKDKDPLRTNKPEVPLINRSVHAKWGALFRKHLGVLEAHCKALDRVQQAMKSEMKNLSEEEKREWELNEEGPWRILCGLLDRGRDTLVSGRKMAQFVLPPRLMKDRKGLGVLGTNYEPLVPQLDARLAAEKNGTATTKTNESNNDSSDSSSDSSSSSDSDSDSDAAEVGGYEDEDVEMEDAPVAESKKDPSTSAPVETESSAHFFVDTEPTPVADLDMKDKKDKKRKADDALVGRKSKREKKSEEEEKKIEEEEVNFQAMEAQLQAEVEAGMKAQEEKAQNAEEKKEKKRKRDSNVEENEGKKSKKEKKNKKVEEEVKEAEEVEVEPEVEQAPEPEVESKKEKKSKKDKKRKADDVAAEDEQIDGKRKRKSK
ncbi:uncharacterized protein EAE97_000783 [Botrytis byssoidea]|uniref:Uncharacterized protein n=1 Tax=Botrytis byssoidea TaxID=139641 RepID=A0A9P5IT58_9HELO|nr:uncharacterized protein EAE97_000783 [Botrytis byssoidea]KAF7953384.1 hypothetical protein EAE97_000783 [Botrytis byssoidea]